MKAIFSIGCCLITFTMWAQDNHYWAQQYGAQSNLLGGAVVAGIRDNAAVMYNPGALGFISKSSLSVSANVYRLAQVKTKNGAGLGLRLRSLRFSLFPQMISGLINIKKNPNWRLGYALITRNHANERIVFRHEMFYDVFTGVPGEEEFIGSIYFDNQINEQWGGLAVSRKINEHFSVGITTFISYRNQKYQLQNSSNTVILAPPQLVISRLDVDQDVVIDDFKMLWKAGIAYQKNGWKAGITITTPSVHLFGFASVTREESFINYPIDDPTGATGNIIDILATDRQEALTSVTYKSPFSIAIGLEYDWKKSRLMMAAEFFQSLGTYNIITPVARPFIRPSNLPFEVGQDKFLAVSYPTKSVTNVGIGYDLQLSKMVNLHLGFRTDFTAYDEENPPDDFSINMAPVNFGLLHYSAGVTLNGKVTSLTAGFEYARGFAASTTEPLVRFDRPESLYGVPVEPIPATTTANQFTIVLGFTYFFKRGEGASETNQHTP